MSGALPCSTRSVRRRASPTARSRRGIGIVRRLSGRVEHRRSLLAREPRYRSSLGCWRNFSAAHLEAPRIAVRRAPVADSPRRSSASRPARSRPRRESPPPPRRRGRISTRSPARPGRHRGTLAALHTSTHIDSTVSARLEQVSLGGIRRQVRRGASAAHSLPTRSHRQVSVGNPSARTRRW